jgi:hypothetical protein
MDAEALDAHLLARGIGTHDLAKLTGLDIATVGSARKGRRVSRMTVLKIVDTLAKIPVRPEVAALIGLPVVEQNGKAKGVAKKKTGGVKRRRSEEVPRAGGRSRKTE